MNPIFGKAMGLLKSRAAASGGTGFSRFRGVKNTTQPLTAGIRGEAGEPDGDDAINKMRNRLGGRKSPGAATTMPRRPGGLMT